MRLIDGHTLMERLQQQTEVITSPAVAAGLLMAQGVVLETPTIDAVEVVRCKDCRYSHMTYSGSCKYCDKWEEDGEALYLDGDFYCAYGERREDGEA